MWTKGKMVSILNESRLEWNLSELQRNRPETTSLIEIQFSTLSVPPELLDDNSKRNPNLAGDGQFDASLYKNTFPLDLGFSNDYFLNRLGQTQAIIDSSFIVSTQPDSPSDNFSRQGIFVPSVAPQIQKIKIPCKAISGLQGNAIHDLYSKEILCVMTVRNLEGIHKPVKIEIANYEAVNKDTWIEVHLVDVLWAEDADSPAQLTVSVSEFDYPLEHLTSALNVSHSPLDNLHLIRHSSSYLFEPVTVDLGTQASEVNFINPSISPSVLQNPLIQVVSAPASLPVMPSNIVGQNGIVKFTFDIDFFMFENDQFILELSPDFVFRSPFYNSETSEFGIQDGNYLTR